MSFAAMPAWLVGLLIAGAIGLVVALYLLRRTPRPQVVSNVDFWLRAMENSKPKLLASFRIPLLALLVSLLVACAIVFLAGDPRFGAGVRGTTVVVLDTGRTMGAVEDAGGRRIDHATAEVRRWVERTTITGEVAVVRAGMRASVLLPVTDAAADLEGALSELEVDDGPSDLDAALALADEIVMARSGGDQPRGQILIVTDHVPSHATRAPQIVLPVGTSADTIGIASFAARRVPTAVGEYTVRVAVSNFSSREGHAHVTVRDGDVTLLEETIQLDGHEERVLEAGGFSSARAELTATLTSIGLAGGSDALAVDDSAYAMVEPLEATRVLLATDGNEYLEAALAAHPGLEVDVMSVSGLATQSSESLARYHAVVLDRAALPAGVDHAGVLAFGPAGDRSPVRLGPALRSPRITGALASHAAIAGLRFENVHLTSARPVIEQSGDDVLLRSGDRAIAVARELPRSRIVFFGFATTETDMVRSESFPLLVHHSLAWVADRAEPTPLARRVGGMLLAEAGQEIRGPSGDVIDAPAGVIPTVAHAGIYHVGDRAIAFGGTEHAGPLGAGATGGTFAAESALPPLAVLVAVALLLLMLVEWTLLHRGRLE